MADLFESLEPVNVPLAERLRPKTIDEVVGQRHLLGPGKPLRLAFASGKPHSMILWGPPGVGKTTLARLTAKAFDAEFIALSAVFSGVKDIREAIAQAQAAKARGRHTILFVDEVHRFNKAQQDALLPAVEQGTVVLIGATTENPYFEVNSALVSRSKIFRLEPLSEEEIRTVVERALTDAERGLGSAGLAVDEEALEHIVRTAGGDARSALNTLEAAALLASEKGGRRHVDLAVAEEAAQRRALLYDKWGDSHYDTISAFIKSMRGSDPHAAVYWLARMLKAGEDPRFIARRMVIFASEDVGLADSRALVVADAAARAVEYVGMPECGLNLAHAALYLALAPKSNSATRAIAAASREVEEGAAAPVPPHLRDAHYRGAAELGHGVGYLYPHHFPRHYVEQEYLPRGMEGRRYYEPGGEGEEAELAEGWMERLRGATEGGRRGSGGDERGGTGSGSRDGEGRQGGPTGR